MKAIAYHRFGNTDVLQTAEEPAPLVQSNQVLVKVKAVSINPMDWKIRKGEMKLMSGSNFPKHTGAEFAGVIQSTGTAVTDFKKGDEVFGVVKNTMKDGALAEYIAIPAASVWKKPAGTDFLSAAAIPIAGAAAVTMLEKMGDINAATQILVNGASGGLGMFLLQLLKDKGANVTAVANTQALEFAKRWGADTVVDYTATDVLAGQKTYDIVIDLSGKMGYQRAKKIMKAKSLFLNPTPRPVEIPISVFKNLFRGRKHIVILSQPAAKNINVLLKAVNKGLEIKINKVFPFSQAVAAYQYAERGGVTGKVVIEL